MTTGQVKWAFAHPPTGPTRALSAAPVETAPEAEAADSAMVALGCRRDDAAHLPRVTRICGRSCRMRRSSSSRIARSSAAASAAATLVRGRPDIWRRPGPDRDLATAPDRLHGREAQRGPAAG